MLEANEAQRDSSSKPAEENVSRLQIEPRINWKQLTGCLSANSIALAAGFTMAFPSALFPALLAPDSEIPLTPQDCAWLASCGSLVAPVGALVGGFLMEHLGRLIVIQITVIPFCIGWVLMATAQGFTALLIGRIIMGFVYNISITAAAVLITETALKDYRGACASAGLATHSFGLLCGYTLSAFLYWRTFAWVSILSSLIPFILACIFTAESPLWLRSRGQIEKAQRVSLYYYGDPDYVVQPVMSQSPQIQTDANVEKPNQKQNINRPSFLNQLWWLLSLPSGFKPLIILNVIVLFQHWSGIIIIVVYGVTFFQEAGNTIDPYFAAIMIGVIRFFASFITIFLIRNYGRRPLMLVSTISMAICMAASAYTTSLILNDPSSFSSWFPVGCIVVYHLAATIGLQTIPWTMASELFPQRVRGAAQAVNMVFSDLIMFVALQAYPWMYSVMGGTAGVEYFFAANSLAAAIFAWIYCPEPHGKTLTEIQVYFSKNTIYLGHKK